MPEPSWFSRLRARFTQFIQRLRHGSAQPGSLEFEARQQAEDELDAVRRSQRDQHRHYGGGVNGSF